MALYTVHPLDLERSQCCGRDDCQNPGGSTAYVHFSAAAQFWDKEQVAQKPHVVGAIVAALFVKKIINFKFLVYLL
jgi:hypothetical protein